MIKVMLDTNIFISAALFPKGKVAQAFIKAIQPPFQPYVCDYVIGQIPSDKSEGLLVSII